jgi:hypothetical protein
VITTGNTSSTDNSSFYGLNAAVLAAGGGTVTVEGGTVHTSGMNSAGIYSTGNITVTGRVFVADRAEAAVIEGANSITLNDAGLTASKAGKWGVMIYQSMSGDARGNQGTFTMTRASLSYPAVDGPLFYVTNTNAVITLKGVSLNAASGVVVSAAAGSWGAGGSNGGTVIFTAGGQVLTGDFAADDISSIALTLQNASTLTGAINPAHTAKSANPALDAASTWTVTEDSYLTTIAAAGGISGGTVTGIIGNGHTVCYDSAQAANSWLGGKAYSLAGGGTLQPM